MNYLTKLSIGYQRAKQVPGVLGYASRALSLASPLGIRLELVHRGRTKLSPERRQVAKDFFTSFSNPRAREFYRRTTIANYTEAIMTHHPRAHELNRGEIQRKCTLLVDTILRRLDDVKRRPELLFDVLKTMGRSSNPREAIWFKEYLEAYKCYKHGNKQKKRDAILSPHIKGTSLADFGCGGGDQVADLAARHEDLTRVVGFEVQDWRTTGIPWGKEGLDYYAVDFSQPGTTFSETFDTGMALAVGHHVGKSTQAVATFYSNISGVVKRMIVEEDVIITPQDIAKGFPGMEEMPKFRQLQPFLDEYLKLDQITQRDITTLTDLLSNSLSVGVPEMPFPFGFRTLSSWVNVFQASGFKLNKIVILGFQKRNFNQQCHVLFILDKKD